MTQNDIVVELERMSDLIMQFRVKLHDMERDIDLTKYGQEYKEVKEVLMDATGTLNLMSILMRSDLLVEKMEETGESYSCGC